MTDILQEASELINGQRAQDYGDVTENFARIADMWSAYKGEFFSPHDVAMMMILVKVARQSSGYHHDSIVDIAGYAALDEKVYIGLQVQDIKQQIEAVKEQMRKPRVWQSLTQVPEGVPVHDAVGDCEWESEGPDGTTENDKYGPFTEILDNGPEGSK